MEDYIVYPEFSGGIGERMFQLFAAKYYSEITGLQLKILGSEVLCDLFPNLKVIDAAPENVEVITQNCADKFTFQPFSTSVSSNIKLRGLWQHYEYCAHTYLIPNWQHALKGPHTLTQILESVGLAEMDSQKHAWMLEFKNDPLYIPYYTKCLQNVPDGAHVYVFTDLNTDLESSFNMFKSLEERNISLEWSGYTNNLYTLYVMSHCLGGSILGVGTFGWWGAFFARKRAVNVGHKLKTYYCGENASGPTSNPIPDWGVKIAA
jgi:hypothetical protein